MKPNQHFLIRKIHRYLGVFIGIQFLFWSAGGLYFSWTDIDQIHGDHFRKKEPPRANVPLNLIKSFLDSTIEFHSLETRLISGKKYLWVNGEKLVDLQTGLKRGNITREEAIEIAGKNILPQYKVEDAEYMEEVGPHHEYREQTLPAWVITYEGNERLRAYISANDGKLQRVRYNSWRTFDFLWMLHIMDYSTRDNINNWVLRGFSVLGIITICSGFLLFVYSSRIFKKYRS